MDFGRRNQISLLRPLDGTEDKGGLFTNDLGHKRYHVYVNNTYVGDKLSIAQGDGDAYAVDDFLKSRGFNDLDIDHDDETITIKTQDVDLATQLRRHLSVYLSIR